MQESYIIKALQEFGISKEQAKLCLVSRDVIVPVIQSQWWKGDLSFDAKFIEAMRIKSGRVSPLQILTAPASELREALLRAIGKWIE